MRLVRALVIGRQTQTGEQATEGQPAGRPVSRAQGQAASATVMAPRGTQGRQRASGF